MVRVAAPSTRHQLVDIVPLMTARRERRLVRLAWEIGLAGLAVMVAGLVLLIVDWRIDSSILSTNAPWFANAILVGALGVILQLAAQAVRPGGCCLGSWTGLRG